MNRIKNWHIAELKGNQKIHHSSYTSKTRLVRALIAFILSGRDEFVVTIPHWKTFIIYKGGK